MKIDIGDYTYDETKRKIKIKIHDYDVWSLDCTLAQILVPSLKLFKERQIGVPGNLLEPDRQFSDQHELDLGLSASEIDDLNFKRAKEKWDEILDKMIWSFEQAQDCYYDLNEDYTVRGSIAYQERLEEGFALFGKYFRNLWI